MNVDRIAPGLWRWTAFHPEWKDVVGCVYYEAQDAVCLIDPIVSAGDRDAFFAALDADVQRLGLPVHILVTVFWHTRDARELAHRYGAGVWAPSRARAAVERRAGHARAFRPGDPLPGGVTAMSTARSNEVVFHLSAVRTVVPGDVILGAPDGRLRLCPDSWLPSGTTQEALRKSLVPLLDLRIERVLVSHGDPVLERGHDALAEILAS
jgi:Metallo-beta-lactamase superfamily